MVDLAAAATGSVAEPQTTVRLLDDAATEASVAAYLAAGERMGVFVDICWKVCAGLMVLVALAWVFGLLPAAVKVF